MGGGGGPAAPKPIPGGCGNPPCKSTVHPLQRTSKKIAIVHDTDSASPDLETNVEGARHVSEASDYLIDPSARPRLHVDVAPKSRIA